MAQRNIMFKYLIMANLAIATVGSVYQVYTQYNINKALKKEQ